MLITENDVGKELVDTDKKENVKIVDFDPRDVDYPVIVENLSGNRYNITSDGRFTTSDTNTRYKWIEEVDNSPKKCTCPIQQLMNVGCKCGGI